jgi:mannose-6-phosphate isomerase-like protein (cupin superfamily)
MNPAAAGHFQLAAGHALQGSALYIERARHAPIWIGRMEASMRNAILTSVLLCGAVALAQGPGGAKPPKNEDMLFTAAQMQDILQKVPLKDGKPATVSTRLFTDSTYSCSFIRMTEPDKPHTHGLWSEIYVVQAGAGTLVTGGTMKGPFTGGAIHHLAVVDQNGKPLASAGGAPEKPAQDEPPPPGEDAAGTSIVGGRTQQLKAGDLVLIPAGVPHTWTKVDRPIIYLDIKFPKPE